MVRAMSLFKKRKDLLRKFEIKNKEHLKVRRERDQIKRELDGLDRVLLHGN